MVIRKSRTLGRFNILIVAMSLLGVATTDVFGQAHDETPMELSGYSISEAYDVKDDVALDFEDPYIIRLLYRIKTTSPKSRGNYSKYSTDVTWEKLVETPEDFRFWVFDRTVRLKKITKYRFKSADDDSEIKGVYVCHCENENQKPLIVLSRSMPKNLPVDETIDEPVALSGFLYARSLGVDSQDTETKTPVFITDRLAWHPDKIVEGRSNHSHVVLAQNGVDVGQLDFVEQSNTHSLGKRDSEAFFQMIAGMKDLPLETEFKDPVGFTGLMRKSGSNFGNMARIKGVVRNCTEVQISNADVKKRLGISKYFQLMLFPDLDGGKVKIKNKSGKDVEYQRFPITVCCTELPPGTSEEDLKHKPLVVEGFFFRFWRYKSDMTDAIIEESVAKGEKPGISGQVSPLIIARVPTQIESKDGKLNLIFLAFMTALIAGIVGLFAYFRISDRGHPSPGQEILESLPDKIDVTGIQEH